MDRYYKRAMEHLRMEDREGAIDCFVAGIERGYHKCAYGLLRLVTERGSLTFTEGEAVSIFESSYEKIKEIATQGDTEAMVMVAQAMRLGFIDDESETYFLWLEMAKRKGSRVAERLLAQIEEMEAEEEQAPKEEDEWGELIIKPNQFGLDVAGIRAEPDKTMLDDLGVADMLRQHALRVQEELAVNGGIAPDEQFS